MRGFAFVALAICCLLHSLQGPVPINPPEIAFSKALDPLTLASHSSNSISTSVKATVTRSTPPGRRLVSTQSIHPIGSYRLPDAPVRVTKCGENTASIRGGCQDVGVPGQEKHPENHGKPLVLLSIFFVVNTLGVGPHEHLHGHPTD